MISLKAEISPATFYHQKTGLIYSECILYKTGQGSAFLRTGSSGEPASFKKQSHWGIMPVFRLTRDVIFPPVHLAADGGLLAVGGDLSTKRLLEAYRQGIFPWYGEAEPILWWAPDPRLVLFPEALRISRSMRQFMKKGHLRMTYDGNFREVIAACRKPRPRQADTWITPAMQAAYVRLHELGFAHSVEAWQDDRLVGGLYGVSLGRCFFGESMFSSVSNASKAVLIDLVQRLRALDFALIDCQVHTSHLESLGARHVPRREFMVLLKQALEKKSLRGNWGLHEAFSCREVHPCD
jgi:leucyl/phenylalanyl-tRNA--protein transferase